MGMKMLRSMWSGGIRDWVGGGMARYSVDEKWMVPHFEKMLYDQAQLVSSCLDFARLYPANHQDRLLCYDLAADILKYTLRDLKSPEGGFWSAEDADSAEYKGAKKSGMLPLASILLMTHSFARGSVLHLEEDRDRRNLG